MRAEPTAAEATLWGVLSTRKGWHTQVPLVWYIADFLHVPTSTIVEIDGKHHHSKVMTQKDAKRTHELSKQGYTVVRFDNDTVKHTLSDVLERLDAIIAFRMQNPKAANVPHLPGKPKAPRLKAPVMLKRWTGRGYMRVSSKPDVMDARVPKRKP